MTAGPWSRRWPDVLDTLPTVPVAFQRSEVLRTAWLTDAPDVLYIQTDEIKASDPGEPDPLTEILSKRPRAVILDLRFNSGGDFTQTYLFTQVLPRIMRGHRIYVLVGPGTFSAAIVTASMLKARGGSQVVLVGEPMGDSDGFWAENHILTLPNSGIAVSYATTIRVTFPAFQLRSRSAQPVLQQSLRRQRLSQVRTALRSGRSWEPPRART